MARAIAGFPRWTEKATFSASSSATGYPASNLGELPLSAVWRSGSAGASDTILTATFAQARRIELVVLCRHNLTVGSSVSVTVYSDEAMTSALASVTVNPWPAVFTEAQVDWDGGRWWDRTYTEEEVAGYPWYTWCRVPGAYYCRAVKVEIVDETNPDGFVQAGLLELASELQFPVNPEYGASYGYVSRAQSQQADGGSEYFRERTKGRVFEGSVPYMARDEAMASFLEMRRQLDVVKPFFWLPDPDDTQHSIRNAFLARFSELSLQSYAAHNHDTVPFKVKEVL